MPEDYGELRREFEKLYAENLRLKTCLLENGASYEEMLDCQKDSTLQEDLVPLSEQLENRGYSQSRP